MLKRTEKSLILLSMMIALMICVTPSHAEWGRTANDYIRVPLGPQPKICSDGNRGAWVAANPIGLCHVDRNGNVTWGDYALIIPPAMSYDPHLLLAENGDVILAMNYSEGYDDPPNVHVQRFDLDQEYVWGEEGIALDNSDRMQSVIGAYQGPIEGTYLIHWVRYDENRENIEPRLQLVNGDGDFLWDQGGISLNWNYHNTYFAITSDQCVIAAQNVAPTPTVEIVKIDIEGEQLWDLTLTTLWEGLRHRYLNDAESDRDGGVILTYQYERRETIDDSLRKFRGVNVMRISGDGDSLWTRHLYERDYVYGDRFTINPLINYAGSGRFFVAWADWPHAFQVVALNINGELLWEEPVDVITRQVGYGSLEAVDSDSGVCYVWRETDDREQGSRLQQWGQRISLDGERLWGDRGRAIQARPVEFSSITTDGNGGVITVVDFAIRTIQMINKNGEIGVVLEVGVDEEIDQRRPPQQTPRLKIYPNPFNDIVNIEMEIRRQGDVSIGVWDISGRKVDQIFSGVIDAGCHTFTWSPGVSGSGIYLIVAATPDYHYISEKVLCIR